MYDYDDTTTTDFDFDADRDELLDQLFEGDDDLPINCADFASLLPVETLPTFAATTDAAVVAWTHGGLAETFTANVSGWFEALRASAGSKLSIGATHELRKCFGEFADFADRESDHDTGALVATDTRWMLFELGEHPRTAWLSQLAFDYLDNALCRFDSWRQLEPDAAEAAFERELAELHRRVEKMLDGVRSVAVIRSLRAVELIARGRVAPPDETIERVDRYLALHEQACRETNNHAPIDEVLPVAAFGVRAYMERSAAELQEFVRRIRLLVEAPGCERTPFVLCRIWARGLLHLDPKFANMLAIEQLLALYDENADGVPSDEAFEAAYLVLETKLAVSAGAVDDEVAHGDVDREGPLRSSVAGHDPVAGAGPGLLILRRGPCTPLRRIAATN